MSGSPKIYFDSNIWIYALTQRPPDNFDIGIINKLLKQIEDGYIQPTSSVLIIAEVLQTHFSQKQKEAVNAILDEASNVHIPAISREIIEKSAEIRSFYANKKAIAMPDTPDAIHLATAIEYQCAEFFTLDGKLLKLTTPIAGKYNIKLVKPHI